MYHSQQQPSLRLCHTPMASSAPLLNLFNRFHSLSSHGLSSTTIVKGVQTIVTGEIVSTTLLLTRVPDYYQQCSILSYASVSASHKTLDGLSAETDKHQYVVEPFFTPTELRTAVVGTYKGAVTPRPTMVELRWTLQRSWGGN